jgi:hypothetical protein
LLDSCALFSPTQCVFDDFTAKGGKTVLYYDHEAQRQLARERIADLARDARRVCASAEIDARSRSRYAAWLHVQARRLREHALSRAPAYRA